MGSQDGDNSETSKEPATMDDIKVLEASMSSLESSMSSQMKQLHDMMKLLIENKTSNTSTVIPPKVAPEVTNAINGASSGAETILVEDLDEASKAKGGKDPKSYNVELPPKVYSPDPPIPHPHIVNQGQPPMLTPKSFGKWQLKMRSFLCSSSIELWRIIEHGFKAYNPNNLSRREVVDSQLNATALYMIQQAVGEKDMPHIEQLTTAKEAWNTLSEVFIGNESMRSNRFEEISNEAEGFYMEEGESHEDMYRRLKALATTFRDLGAYYVDDAWVKRKYINALMPFEPSDLKNLKGRHNFLQMSSNDVMQEMAAFKVSTKNAEDARDRAMGMRKGGNLALKAKVVEHEEGGCDEESNVAWCPEDVKYDYNDHMTLAARTFWRDPAKAKS